MFLLWVDWSGHLCQFGTELVETRAQRAIQESGTAVDLQSSQDFVIDFVAYLELNVLLALLHGLHNSVLFLLGKLLS